MNGREYKAVYGRDSDSILIIEKTPENPDPSRYKWVDYHRGWVARYPISDVDRVFSVNTFARYRGHKCEVVSANDDGTMEIQYKDSDGGWAVAMGFVQHNKYEFLKTVPASELHDYHERQRDLLFEEWRERTFPRPPEATP
ncbi:hypothetical protein [Saccharothrix sp. NRRL B-16348]|uniref:hypothetical protein n=1 Tax=Saccharothrix sp. NRRL B-16348 TaxID=1415542 RepID=UPI0006AF29D4|nr:hypothetical protein [Saccharothrix sp. NRRL B-16348]